MDEIGMCDSCGADGVEVLRVRRLYVTPEAWDAQEKVEVVQEAERWCFPCRTHYPHTEAG